MLSRTQIIFILKIVILIAFGASVAWTVQTWRYEKKISDIEKKQAQIDLVAANNTIDGMKKSAENILSAAKNVQGLSAAYSADMALLRKEFKDAKAKPLPVDCRPDDARMRSVSAAVSAANKSLSGREPRQGMPKHP